MSPGEIAPLALYLFQQLGIMLGAGSATVILLSYLVSMRDGTVEPKEAQFARILQHVLELGIVCIVVSGAAITVMHATLGQYEVLSSPAYLFKWILIAFVSAALVMRRTKPFASAVSEGLVGATWYALFIVHMLAPIAAWTDLLFLYAAWMAGFMLLWISLTKLITARTPVVPSVPVVAKPAPIPVAKAAPVQIAPPKPAAPPKMQQPAPPPPPIPKPEPKPPVPPLAIKPILPVVAHAELEAPHKPVEPVPIKVAVPVKPPAPPAAPAPQKPKELIVAETISLPVPTKEGIVKNTDDSDEIPHVYVMPRTPEDAEKHLRSAVLTGFA